MSTTTRFFADYAKRVAKCQKCKMQLEKGCLRVGKIVPNFFIKSADESKPPPDMKQYHHKNCLFEMLFKARPSTKVIDSTDEIEGFDDLSAEDQSEIEKLVEELAEKRKKDGPAEPKTPKKTPVKKRKAEETPEESKKMKTEQTPEEPKKKKKAEEINEESKFNSFYKFTKVCEILREADGNKDKVLNIEGMIKNKKFDGDLLLIYRLLLRSSDKSKYKVKGEDLVKYFAKILNLEESEISEKDEDVSMAIKMTIEKMAKTEKSDWSIQKVWRFLEKLQELENDEQRVSHFKFAAKRLGPIEVQYLIRIILKDLKIETDDNVILKSLHPNAPKVYENNGNLEKLIESYKSGGLDKKKPEVKESSKKSSKKPPAKKSRRDSDSDDDESDEKSDSEDELSDDDSDDDSSDDGISDSDSSESDVSSISSMSEDEDGNLKENETPKQAPKGTRSRPAPGTVKPEEKCPDDMEPCRYGKDCYRKNKEHKEEFWHPSK